MHEVFAVPLPPESLAATSLPRIDYADAYLARLPTDQRYTLDQAVTLVFATAPEWVKALLRLRNALVRPFGLKVEPPQPSAVPGSPLLPGARIGIFSILDRRPDELLLGEDDRHLDFRVSVLLRDESEAQWATVTTVVRFHNARGRAYFAMVRPFHKLIVPTLIRHALHVAASAHKA